jgi:thiamine-phosphate pyrophosphorylase
MQNTVENRCRLVLIAPNAPAGADFAEVLRLAMSGGDVASVIFPSDGSDDAAFQTFLEACVPVAQEFGAAAIVADDTRAYGRSGADGLHVDTGLEDVESAIERLQGRSIVGAGGITTRHDALEFGQLRPDYVFFGKFGFDTKPEPHKRNLELARWWSNMIEIPCIVQAGSMLASTEIAAATGADFVALSAAIFGEGIDPAAAVADANAILSRFEFETKR